MVITFCLFIYSFLCVFVSVYIIYDLKLEYFSTVMDEAIRNHLRDPRYCNWLKNGLALTIVNNVLRPFVKKEISKFHQSIKDKMQSVASPSTDVFEEEIKKSHRYPNPSFKNTVRRKWSTKPWEIAKCYMPELGRYKACTAEDCDISATLNVIINNRHFDALVSCSLDEPSNEFCKARQMRNHLMHSDTMKVSGGDMQENFDTLIRIMKTFKTEIAGSSITIQQMEQLKEGKIELTFDNVYDVRLQTLLAKTQEVDDIQVKVEDCIRQIEILKEQIQSMTPIPPNVRLTINFKDGARHSLIKLVQRHILKFKPQNEIDEKWTLTRFLEKIEVVRGMASLCDRHHNLLYPDDGTSPREIDEWDLFLLCCILTMETKVELSNDVRMYVKGLKATRDRILDSPESLTQKDLEVLCGHLSDSQLRDQTLLIFRKEDQTEDSLSVQSVLKTWQSNEDTFDSRKVSHDSLDENKKMALRVENIEKEMHKRLENMEKEMQKRLENIEKEMQKPRAIEKREPPMNQEEEKDAEEKNTTYVRVETRNCDKEETMMIEENFTSKDKNIAKENGSFNKFIHMVNGEDVGTEKGSIILKVSFSSIKKLVDFWDMCMDGRAVEALSDVRDTYRKHLRCDTLEFDVILSTKEVLRCMDNLVQKISSNVHNKGIMDLIGDAARRHINQGTGKDISAETEQGKSFDKERTERQERMKETPETGEETSTITEQRELFEKGPMEEKLERMKLLPTDVMSAKPKQEEFFVREELTTEIQERKKVEQPGTETFFGTGSERYGDDEANRLVKLLRQISENTEEGKISTIRPYLADIIDNSKKRDIAAFKESVVCFSRKFTFFKRGISAHQVKMAHLGFVMIQEDPMFGDLVLSKIDLIDKEEQTEEIAKSREKSIFTPIDKNKSSVEIVGDIDVAQTGVETKHESQDKSVLLFSEATSPTGGFLKQDPLF